MSLYVDLKMHSNGSFIVILSLSCIRLDTTPGWLRNFHRSSRSQKSSRHSVNRILRELHQLRELPLFAVQLQEQLRAVSGVE